MLFEHGIPGNLQNVREVRIVMRHPRDLVKKDNGPPIVFDLAGKCLESLRPVVVRFGGGIRLQRQEHCKILKFVGIRKTALGLDALNAYESRRRLARELGDKCRLANAPSPTACDKGGNTLAPQGHHVLQNVFAAIKHVLSSFLKCEASIT